jgi:hypothetical protein
MQAQSKTEVEMSGFRVCNARIKAIYSDAEEILAIHATATAATRKMLALPAIGRHRIRQIMHSLT